MTFKFICLNAWHGNRLEALLDFLRTENPDVVALQEISSCEDPATNPGNRTLETLAEQFPHYHQSYAPAAFDAGIASHPVIDGSLVLSRFPVVSSSVHFYDVPYGEAPLTEPINTPEEQRDWTKKPRNFQDVGLELPGGQVLHVLNTQGIWDHHDRDTDRRLVMAETLSAAAGRYDLSLLCGDMNLGKQTAAAAAMRQGRVDVFSDMLTTSFNMKYKNFGGFPKSVVDMVFVSPGATVVSKNVLSENDITDHVPLICTLELP